MDKTALAIIIVIFAFAGIYLAIPEGPPGNGTATQVADMPPERNGMVGRVLDGLAELTWHPAQLFIIFIVAGASLAGLALYWRKCCD